MGAEFRGIGYTDGQRTAYDCRREIRKSHADDLPELAGVKMILFAKASRNPLCDSDSWREGFWEGFLDKCEDLRG